jgi:hypothetical protein
VAVEWAEEWAVVVVWVVAAAVAVWAAAVWVVAVECNHRNQPKHLITQTLSF